MRTVFHLSTGDADEVARGLANVTNLLADDSVALDSVVVVANGDGVYALGRDATTAGRVGDLLDASVVVVACGNSMRGRGLDRTDLVEGVAVASSGMGELTRRQHDGYAYIRVP